MEVTLQLLLVSSLNIITLQASRLDHFTAIVHWIGLWLGPKLGHETLENVRIYLAVSHPQWKKLCDIVENENNFTRLMNFQTLKRN